MMKKIICYQKKRRFVKCNRQQILISDDKNLKKFLSVAPMKLPKRKTFKDNDEDQLHFIRFINESRYYGKKERDCECDVVGEFLKILHTF